MSSLLIQRLIAVPFLVLGAWCVLAPHSVERLTVTPEYQHLSPASALFIGCFGAQALISGLFAWFARFTRTTFLAYAIALLPFFWFNYWFVFEVPIFNRWLTIDFVSNTVMLALCLMGYRAARA